MGLGAHRGMMWAGVVDGHIATDTDQSIDEYTPITVALFPSEELARQHYETVVKVDVDAILRIGDRKSRSG